MPKSTKNQIMNALAALLRTKRLDDITVTELVEKCGISRQAFYYHFSDLYGVVDYGIQMLLEKMLKNFLDDQNFAGLKEARASVFESFGVKTYKAQ